MIQMEITKAAVGAACQSMSTLVQELLTSKETQIADIRFELEKMNRAVHLYSDTLHQISEIVKLNKDTISDQHSFTKELMNTVSERMRLLQALLIDQQIRQASNAPTEQEPREEGGRTEEHGANGAPGVSPEGEPPTSGEGDAAPVL